MKYKFGKAAIGGTFDHLHKGHKYFIDKAFKNSEFVIIGVTVDGFSKGKEFSYLIESFKTRKDGVCRYLKNKGYDKRSEIIPIKDIYGSTLKDRDIDVIFTDESGFENAEKINVEREKIGFPKIEIVKNNYIKDEEGGIISSTKIRKGYENRDGLVYNKSFKTSEILRLPLTLRDRLRKPFGKVEKKLEREMFDNKPVIAVGDIAVAKLYEMGVVPAISIYDLKTVRSTILDEKVLRHLPKEDVIVENPQGEISRSASEAVERAINESFEKMKTVNVKVVGEEDLLALPAMLLSPLKTLIVYGIRDRGAVVVEVNEELKGELLPFLQKFVKI